MTTDPAGIAPSASAPGIESAASPWRPWLFVAAHPDDETIGAGGLLASLRSAIVVHLTDGAPRDRRFWPQGVGGPSWEYARLRREELAAALDAAGLVAPLVLGLGASDQEAALQLPSLVERLESILAAHRPGVLITHPYEGGHPDHDAAAFVAHSAAERLRRAGRPAPLLVEMTSYHARGEAMETAAFLDRRGHEVVRLLTEERRARKERMLAAYESQRDVLRAFGLDHERFRRAPAYDFTRPPGPEPLLYERWSFPITGRRWRELATDALRALGLEDRRSR